MESAKPTGRVAFSARGHARLWTADGEHAAIRAPWVEYVVVGDVVHFDEGDPLVITHRLERRSKLSRRDPGGGEQVVAANVDHALICMACDGDFNPRRLERWLLIVREAGIDATVVLTKSDCTEDLDALVAEAARLADPTGVIAISTTADHGLDVFRALLVPEHTYVLLGSSGVGKSTLTNALLGADVMPTGPVRADDRGRHTTSARHLLALPGGSWLIDNPGTRGVGPLGDADLGMVFPEVEAVAKTCRFRDCHHAEEPGCAVNAAVVAGTLDPVRLAAWQRLQRELAFHARREDPRARAAARARWKRIHKAQRRHYRDKYGE